MENTIFNVYVPMENQGQCDRMKQLCIDNNLRIWNDKCAYKYSDLGQRFEYSIGAKEFWCTLCEENEIKVTESEFIDLLKKHKL